MYQHSRNTNFPPHFVLALGIVSTSASCLHPDGWRFLFLFYGNKTGGSVFFSNMLFAFRGKMLGNGESFLKNYQ